MGGCLFAALQVLRYFMIDKSRCMGFKLEAEHLETTLRNHYRLLCGSACATIVLHRRDALTMLCRLTNDVLAQGGEAISFSTELRYDETPMRARTASTEKQPQPTDAVSGAFVGWQPLDTMCCDTATAKILATTRSVAALYKLGSGRHIVVRVEIPCWLQCLGQGKAENYLSAICQTEFSLPADVADLFQRHYRVVCTDADAAVDRCERAMELAHPNAGCLKTKCEIHRAYNMHKKTFRPIDGQLTACIRIALSLKLGDTMRSFRLALRRVLDDKLVFRPNSAPSEQTLRNNRARLDLFLQPATPLSRLRRAIILSMTNGDWGDPHFVVHYCSGCCADRKDCLRKLQTVWASAVVNTSPPVWPRSRWKGAKAAIDWLGLLESIHSLLSTVYLVWAQIPEARLIGGGDIPWFGGLELEAGPAKETNQNMGWNVLDGFGAANTLNESWVLAGWWANACS